MLNPDQWVLEDKDSFLPLKKWQKTVDVMARVFNAPAGFIVQLGSDGYQVVISSKQETNPYPAGGSIPSDTNIFCKKVVQTQQALYVNNAAEDREWDDNPEVADDGFSSYLGLPVNWPQGQPFGTICVMDHQVTSYSGDYVDLIAELRDLIEADLELLYQYEELSKIAMSDELTQLYNRRGFLIIAQQHLALARRSELSLGMLFLDMDKLKPLNDRLGHQAGDKALQSLATTIQKVVRKSDIAARLSGDEFVVLAAAETQQQLEQMAERIHNYLKEHNLTVSIGSVMIDDHSVPLEQWLDEADRRMYQQKHGK